MSNEEITADDIVVKLYDKGHHEGTDSLSMLQRHVWFYVDYTIYVDNGGAGGFIYNHSPTIGGENFYAQYYGTWTHFGFERICIMAEKYNVLFHEVLKLYLKDGESNFEMHAEKLGLRKLQEEFENIVKESRDDNKVWNWIEENKKVLMEEI
ncbi:MAG: hypothetical protein K0S32_2558 [Bacteroidetes bacterium]|jgi:hypothetical protein|nr:hypothetical protein [Bacteroidota bacterium]